MSDLFQFLLRQGDNALVLGHRTSQWCGTGPALEEDIALTNTALDLIGQTQMWLAYAAEIEDAGRSANDLAYLRDAWDFRNLLLVEFPNGDFGHTLMRQYLFDAFQVPWLTALQESTNIRVSEIAAKSVKEARYHLERSRDTVIALGDGTQESNARMQAALDRLWPYVGEMFVADDTDKAMTEDGTAPDLAGLRGAWDREISATMKAGELVIPDDDYAQMGGRNGKRHTEHLGHMLAEMQVLQRSYPGATW